MIRHDLLIQRSDFEATLSALMHVRERRTSSSTRGVPESLAIGKAVAHDTGDHTCWVVAELRTANDSLPTGPARLNRWQRPASRVSADALIVLTQASNRVPTIPAAWREWWTAASQREPALRALASQTTLFLGIDGQGHAGGALRHGGSWLPLATLRLPGAEMLRIPLSPLHVEEDDPNAMEDLVNGRYSRIAGALGEAVLRSMQQSVFGVIGAGRTGSALAHTLARNGASLLVIDPDLVEPHNLDGDCMLPVHEGISKVDALARSLRPLLRRTAWLGARCLDIGSPIAGQLLGSVQVIVSAVDNDPARLWTLAWSQAWKLPHLDIATGVPLGGEIGAEIRLILPGRGCLVCVGGLADTANLPDAIGAARAVDGDFRRLRRGSLRSIGVTAAHLGVRLLEQLYAGTAATHRFVRLSEDAASGTLRIDDRRVAARPGCAVCGRLSGIGPADLTPELMASLAAHAAGTMRVLS